jgi:hypothetical protein
MPMRIRSIVAVLVLLTVAALAFALPASAGGKPYRITLTGAAELPDPGDPNATGMAHVTINPGHREVCWTVSVQNVDLPVVAAHIHVGPVTSFGPPVVFLLPMGVTDADGTFSGCTTVSRELAFQLLLTPENYYVNVHTTLFPNGAARGQLG